MGQETMNIALPETLKQFVLREVSEGGYSTASEYIRELIRAERKRKSLERLEALVLEGLQGGEPSEMTMEDWDELKRRVWQRHAGKHGK